MRCECCVLIKHLAKSRVKLVTVGGSLDQWLPSVFLTLRFPKEFKGEYTFHRRERFLVSSSSPDLQFRVVLKRRNHASFESQLQQDQLVRPLPIEKFRGHHRKHSSNVWWRREGRLLNAGQEGPVVPFFRRHQHRVNGVKSRKVVKLGCAT